MSSNDPLPNIDALPEGSGASAMAIDRRFKQGRLREEVSTYLTELILSEQLPRGDFLPREEDLASRFGVSRTVVREAIRVLEARSLVAPKPGVGTVITGNFEEQLADALTLSIRGERVGTPDQLEFRRLIEGHAAFLAATRATMEEIEGLKALVKCMEAPSDSDSLDPIEADVAFHVLLAEASHNALLALVVRAIRHVLRQSIQRTLPLQTQMEMRLAYHRRIVEAIADRDAEAAAAAVHEHLHDTEHLLRASLEQG